jgi:hypothetical protein
MTAARRGGVPLSALRRVTRTRPVPADGERCEMCAKPITKAHSHVVDLHSRSLMCACRPCYLLFTDMHATLHYRSVPERYLALDRTAVDGRTWDELQIPVGLAFLFRNSVQQRMVAFYPGPAGATESELPLAAWDRIVAQSPQLALLRPDVEALLVRRPGEDCFVVPIDACYELVGRIRKRWKGFAGGEEAWQEIDAFFAGVREKSGEVGGWPT